MVTKWSPGKWRQRTRMLLLAMILMVCSTALYAQAPANNECSGAIALAAPTGTCSNTAGTTVGATLSMAAAPCNGNPDDDVWYSFVASTTDVKIDISGTVAVVGGSTDMYFQVLSGTCGSFTSLLCSDPDNGIVGGLTPGQTYYIRVYTYSTGVTANFNLCVTNFTSAPTACATLNNPANNSQASTSPSLAWGTVTNALTYDVYLGTTNPPTAIVATTNTNSYTVTPALPVGTDYYWYVVPRNSAGATTGCATNTRKFTTVAAPPNNECANARVLTQTATCTNLTDSTVGATFSMAAAPCSGNPDDDVWFSFVATATDAKIALSGVSAIAGGSTDMYFQVLSGTCGSLTSLLCSDPDNAIIGGLTVGQTYYIRVYTYGAGVTAKFSICVTTLTAPSSCATLNNPANNIQVTATPSLTWSSVTNAVAYDVYMGSTNPPTTLLTTINGNSNTSYTIPSALALGDYYWYVAPRNSAGGPTNCSTNTRKFTVVAPPSNDECTNAKVLIQAATCTNTTDSTVGATSSMAAAPCNGNPDDDIWYSFVATASDAKITISGVTAIAGGSTDMYFQLLSGACGSLSSLLCSDPNEAIYSGLTVGQTYYIRVYTYSAGVTAKFSICVTSLPVPVCATLASPANNDLTPATLALSWNSVTNATAYDVYLGTTNPPTTLLTTVNGNGTTSYTIPTALALGNYYWYVVPKNGSGAATGCAANTRKFTAVGPPANDECSGAEVLTVNPDFNCGATTNGTTVAATQSNETAPTVNAAGTNDDVWYTFTATNAIHKISLTNITGLVTDMAMAIYSGNCGSLVHIQSSDPETMTVTGLTPGQSYKVRVYTYTATPGSSASFTICVGTPPPPPPNDNCNNAIALTVNPDYNCGTTTNGTTVGATQSTETAPTVGVSGVDDDVWYSFTATNTSHTITLSNVTGNVTDMAMAIYSGNCGTLVHVQSSDPNTMIVNGLTVGQNYKIRVYTYSSTYSDWASFTICVGAPPPPPANDNCAGAVPLTVNPDYLCGVTANGTTAGATQSTETAPTVAPTGVNDDVWYSFTATNTTHVITLSNVNGNVTDMAMAIYSGNCGALVHVQSSDPNMMTVTGLTVGQNYKVRVYTYTATVGSWANFTICVGTPPPPPANDNCSSATVLTVNADYNCGVTTVGSTASATQSPETPVPTVGATGINDDVWYSFTATSATHSVSLSNVNGLVSDMAMAIYSGNCGALTLIQSSDPDIMIVNGLTPGQVYRVRVYTYSSTAGDWANFTICVGSAPAPSNNDCANATSLLHTVACTNTPGTTAGATMSMAATPCNGNPDDDVWYSFVATGTDAQVALSNVVAVLGTSTDMYFQVLSGACGSPTSLLCSDPNTGTVTGLTPGQTYYIRVYTYGATNAATFNICVTNITPPTVCSVPPSVTVPAGSITASAATINWTIPPTGLPIGYQWEVRTSGAPGSGTTGLGASGSTTTATTSATGSVLNSSTTYSAYVRTVCGTTNFSAWSPATVFTTLCNPPLVLTRKDSTRCGTGVVVLEATTVAGAELKWYTASTGGTAIGTGSPFTTPSISSTTTYYVSAATGSTCESGRLPVIATVNANPVASVTPSGTVLICSGSTTTLTAGGGGTYQWRNAAGNIAGQTAGTFTTGTAGAYRVVVKTPVTGCTDTSAAVTVNVVPQPTVFLGNDTTFCAGNTLTLDAANAGATFLWDNGSTGQTRAVSASGIYHVKVTTGNCSQRDTIAVTVNPVPAVNLGNDTNICLGQTYTLNAGNAGATYLWDNSTTAQTRNVTATGSYSVKVTNTFNCTARDTVAVTFLAAPVVNLGNDVGVCAGTSVTLDAGNPGHTYLWNDGTTTQTKSVSASGTYYVTVTNIANCKGSDTVIATINPNPVVNLGNDTTICHNVTLSLNAGNPGATYLWSNGTTAQTLGVNTPGNYSVVVTDANACTGTDNINITVTNPPSGTINAVYGSAATYTFNVLSPQNVTGYTWNFGDGSPLASGASVQHTYTANGIYTVSVSLGGACSDSIKQTRTVDVFDAGGTSIPHIEQDKDLVLYPNPAKDVVIIENRNNLKMKQITVYNVVGQVLSSTKADSGDKHKLNTTAFASGIYTLRIETDKGTVIRKFELMK